MNGTTVFFDLETGGVEDRHPNVQIAAVAVKGPDYVEVASFERKILFDPNECEPSALILNGYDSAKWTDASTEANAMLDFDDFLKTHADLRLTSKAGRPYTVARLAGHNVMTFDVPRLRRAMAKAGRDYWSGCWWYPLDTYQRALWYFASRDPSLAPANYQLQTLAKAFGIEQTGTAHEALADVRTCVALAEAMDYGDVLP